jgi:hypothetical protein
MDNLRFKQLCEQLLAIMKSQNLKIIERVQPGLQREEIYDALISQEITPHSLILDWYEIQGGIDPYTGNVEDANFYKYYWIPTLDLAIEDIMTARYTGHFSPEMFPILQEDSYFYVVDFSKENTPIIAISDESDQHECFISFQVMIDTMYEWYKQGVFSINTDGYVDSRNDSLMIDIAIEMNPDVEYWVMCKENFKFIIGN